jgi:hypothetical protein
MECQLFCRAVPRRRDSKSHGVHGSVDAGVVAATQWIRIIGCPPER